MSACKKKTESDTRQFKLKIFQKVQKQYIFITKFLNTITYTLNTTTTTIFNDYLIHLREYKLLLHDQLTSTKLEQRDSTLTTNEIIELLTDNQNQPTIINFTPTQTTKTRDIPTIQTNNFYPTQSPLKKYINEYY